MGLRCWFGFHRPTLGAVEQDQLGYYSTCRFCGRDIRRLHRRKWIIDKRAKVNASSWGSG